MAAGPFEVAELERAVAVGTTRARSVRLWMRSPGGGPHRLVLWREEGRGAPTEVRFQPRDGEAADHTSVLEYPDGCEGGAQPLEPLTAYRFRIGREDGTRVGEGRFETAPERAIDTPRRFSFAIASCHQPFDEEGRIHPQSVRMMQAAHAAWAGCGVKFVLWTGDQFYADYPPPRSLWLPEVFRHYAPQGRDGLLACTGPEVRRIYQARYRQFWAMPEWQALQADFPGYVMLDDHEVVDNFGSLRQHHRPEFAGIRQGAGAAWRDYQHSRMAPPPEDGDGPYDFAFDYGSVGVYMLDTRSMRRAHEGEVRVFAPHQLETFERWLAAHETAPALFIVCSVPVFFIPGWLAWLARKLPSEFSEDAHDRWAHPDFAADRLRLLELVRRHQQRCPEQRVALIAGDVHVGYASRCDWRTRPPTSLYQFVSSPITHELDVSAWAMERHLPRTHFALWGVGERMARVHMMGSRFARLRQPVGGLNVGVVEVDLGGPHAQVSFKLFGVDPKRPGVARLLLETEPV